jgi:hypothetical protein
MPGDGTGCDLLPKKGEAWRTSGLRHESLCRLLLL